MNKRIKELRKTLKLTMEKFGKELGIRSSTVSEWEHGKNIPESARRHICAVFHVNRDWLDEGRGEMFAQSKTPEELDREAFKRVVHQFVRALPPELRSVVVEVAKEVAQK